MFLFEWGNLDDLTGQPMYSYKVYLKVEVVTDISAVKA